MKAGKGHLPAGLNFSFFKSIPSIIGLWPNLAGTTVALSRSRRGYKHIFKGEKFYVLGVDHSRNLDLGGGTPGASARMEGPAVIGALTSNLSVGYAHNELEGDVISSVRGIRWEHFRCNNFLFLTYGMQP